MYRRFLLVLTVVAVLTACGAQPATQPSGEASVGSAASTAAEPSAAGASTAPEASVAPEASAEASVEASAEASVAGEASAAAETSAAAESSAAPAEAAAGFPLTFEHKYGSTELTARPERVVNIGLTDQDAFLALGVVPVGTTEWFGEHPGAIWPWATDKLDGTTPQVVGGGDTINYELISQLNPDVITALYGGITQEQYDLLSQIAPTIAQPGTYVDYGIPWNELTETVGRILGKEQEAKDLVVGVQERFDQVRAEHPEFEGATSVVATPYEGIWVYGREDPRGRFLTTLGFTLPEELDTVTGNTFGGNLSLERADLLDVDVIVWLDASEAKGDLGGPLYSSFKVHTEGREVMLSSYKSALGGATSFVSVLSLPYLLDGLVPELATAIDGDPATQVTPEDQLE